MSLPDVINVPQLVSYWVSFAEKNHKDMKQQLAELHLKTYGTRKDLLARLLDQYKNKISNDKNIVAFCDEIKEYLNASYPNLSETLGDHNIEKHSGSVEIWKRFKEWMKKLLSEPLQEEKSNLMNFEFSQSEERSKKRRRVTEGEEPIATQIYNGVPPSDLDALQLILARIMEAYLRHRPGPNLTLENEVAQTVARVSNTELRVALMGVLFPK
jgi:hypothetical protein